MSDEPTSLLDDRLTIRAPAGIENEAHQESIMAAPTPEDEETRLMLSVRRQMLMVVTYEMFAVASYDFALDAGRWASGLEDDWGSIEVADLETADPSLRAYSFTPRSVPITDEPIFVLGVLVASPDDTIQYLAFYVNPDAASDLEGARDLSLRMAGTLSAGSRPMGLSAGTRSLQFAPNGHLTLTLPENMAVTHEIGPDFDVFRVWPVGPLLEVEGSIGIYVGGYPSYQYNQTNGAGPVTEEPGRLFGQDVMWRRWSSLSSSGEVRIRLEAIVPYGSSENLFVHVFLRAPDEAQLERLRGIAETLRLNSPSNP